MPEELPFGHWVQSHEEDTADAKVYRPEGYPLPRSRGRTRFQLRADGSFIWHGIAATDGNTSLHGQWERVGTARIRVTFAEQARPPLDLHVLDARPDRLLVRIESAH